MATLQMLINLFPAETGGIQAVAALLLGIVALGVGGATFAFWRRASRRRNALSAAREHGLSERSAAFFAQAFQHEPAGVPESLLSAPDLLVKRLVLCIARQRDRQAALHVAADAARLLDELDLRVPAFDGAPLPCEPLLLSDPSEPAGPGVLVFVAAADEKNLIVVSPASCPWPLRRNLLAMPGRSLDRTLDHAPAAAATTGTSPASAQGSTNSNGGADEAPSDGRPPRRQAFEVALLLRPMPPQHEWVLTHALVETITNRRATVRVPCRIETVTLPDAGDPLLVRQRLQREERVSLDELRGSRAWSQRLTVTVVDISADGARLALSQPLKKHQRLHLLLARPDESLLALPLAEVVDVRRDEGGGTLAGLRFIGVRMKERLGLADYVRSLAAARAAPRTADAHRQPQAPGRPRGSGL